MTIANFDPQKFGENLAQQAQQLIPDDITEEQKNYVINKVYQFCILAGNALNQDTNININADQACIITQFIGEWTFHKSIDLIRAGVPSDIWDQILQEVAFAAFEKAKHTQVAGVPQDQITSLIEKEVMLSYEKSLREFVKSQKINEQDIPKILSYSNIEQLSRENKANDQPLNADEERNIKYASIALLLKSLPEEKRRKILSGMGQQEVDRIKAFMQVQDLEQKINPALVNQFLKDFKQNLATLKRSVYSQTNSIMSLKELFTEIEIKNSVQYERKKIREYVEYCLVDLPATYSNVVFSPQVTKIIANYIKSKISA